MSGESPTGRQTLDDHGGLRNFARPRQHLVYAADQLFRPLDSLLAPVYLPNKVLMRLFALSYLAN